MHKNFKEKDLVPYLGEPMQHPIEYWSVYWRLLDDAGKYFTVRCKKDSECIIYYTDEEGYEHRDAINTVKQLPMKYRTRIAQYDNLETSPRYNSSTPITLEKVLAAYGEPKSDPDLPFISVWQRGVYELRYMGDQFSVSNVKTDERIYVQVFGNLPAPFRFVLSTQRVGEDQKVQVPVDVVDPEVALLETKASKKAKSLEQNEVTTEYSTKDINKIKTISDLSDVDLNATLNSLDPFSSSQESEARDSRDDLFQVKEMPQEKSGPPPEKRTEVKSRKSKTAPRSKAATRTSKKTNVAKDNAAKENTEDLTSSEATETK